MYITTQMFSWKSTVLYNTVLSSLYLLRYVWGNEPQPKAHPAFTAIAQLHWGSALVIHQMFSVISLLKVVTKPQRVKRQQSVNQSSLYIYIYVYIYIISFSIILHLMLLFLVCELFIVYFFSFFITIFNFNDIQLLRILFRTKLYFLSVKRKTARQVHYSEKSRSIECFTINSRKCDGCPTSYSNPIRLLLEIIIEGLFTH